MAMAPICAPTSSTRGASVCVAGCSRMYCRIRTFSSPATILLRIHSGECSDVLGSDARVLRMSSKSFSVGLFPCTSTISGYVLNNSLSTSRFSFSETLPYAASQTLAKGRRFDGRNVGISGGRPILQALHLLPKRIRRGEAASAGETTQLPHASARNSVYKAIRRHRRKRIQRLADATNRKASSTVLRPALDPSEFVSIFE